MNFASWNEKNFVAVAEEDLRENFETVAAYISANPAKVYLLPASDLCAREELSDVRFALEIEFPCPATLITASKKFIVNTLSEMLELASEENFLIVPENFSDTANAIRRQCFLLQVPIKICSEKDFAALAAEQKLREHEESLLKELAVAKKFFDGKSELKLAENISLLENFFAATEKLERHLKSSNEPIKLAIAGATKDFKLFAAKIISEGSYSEELQTCDVCIFAVNILADDLSRTEKFLRAVKSSPNKDKIIFAAIRSALREQDSAINPSRKIFELTELLNAEGFTKNLIFFLDAPDVFCSEKILTLLKNNDEPLTPERIMGELSLTGRDEFLIGLSPEKFFEAQPVQSSETLLKKSGIACLENYLRSAGQKNFAEENLFGEVNEAFSFLAENSLKKIRLHQMQKLVEALHRAENSHEKILLIAAQGKILQEETTIKAILFDADFAIKNFVRSLEEKIFAAFEKLVTAEEFSSEKLAALHSGKTSSELKKLVDDAEKNISAEYSRLAKIFLDAMAKIIETHLARAKKFLDMTKTNPPLPEVKNFSLPNFDTGLTENFSRENLINLINICTKIFCVEEAADTWDEFKAERARLLKRLYLSGTFRKNLRRNLEETAREKLSDLEKILRKNFFEALVEYFGQVSKICKAQQNFCLNTFRKQVEDICGQTDFLIRDFAIMETITSALKELHATWRLIFTTESVSQPVDEKFLAALSAEIIERKNLLVRMKEDLNTADAADFSFKKFLPHETPEVSKVSLAEENFSAAKRAFRNKKYENAFKLFSQAAVAGHVEALKYLAYMNQNALGTPKNIYRAIEKFFDAFRLGDVISAGEIAELCLELKCFSHAMEFYQTAADGGDKYSSDFLES
ncbi:MAG: sel1 repeat family protein [Selenomonadaceae bacterium]|nr:sel1 repeat family protein [Selenomonadaceae bacterium]